jgi:hypothetical protein
MRSLLAVLACTACHSSGTWTKGQRGVASFAYRASPGCEDGCDLETHAIAGDGAHQIVAFSGATFASLGSSAQQVASFMKNGDNIEVVTAAPGDADLMLLDAGGTEIDRVTVHVAAVAQFDFMTGWAGSGPVVLEGIPITTAPITKRDSGVRILLGASAVHFSVSGTLTSLGAPPPTDPAAPPTILESLVVQGTAGSGAIHAANGSQTLDLPVTVVTVNDLNKLVAGVQGSYLGSGGGTVDSNVTWQVSSAGGLVYGASCTWTVSDPSVLMDNMQPANQLDREATGFLVFKMSKPGTFMATCKVGSLSVSVPLKRDS